jgi:hypothetical protein
MELNAYLQKASAWLLTSGLHILLVSVLTLIALKGARVFSTRTGVGPVCQLGGHHQGSDNDQADQAMAGRPGIQPPAEEKIQRKEHRNSLSPHHSVHGAG